MNKDEQRKKKKCTKIQTQKDRKTNRQKDLKSERRKNRGTEGGGWLRQGKGDGGRSSQRLIYCSR